MSREVTEETLEKIDKQFLTAFDKEGESQVLAYNTFVRSSAHTALTQIFKDAIEYDPRVASLLASRVVNFIYEWHHQLALRPIEEQG